MTPKKREAIKRYRELTKGLKGKELGDVIHKFRCGDYTQDIYPHNK